MAGVASRIFGTRVGPQSVIEESLCRATDPTLDVAAIVSRLAATVTDPLPDTLTDEEPRCHPLAVWTELELGLEEKQRLARRKPIPLGAAAARLAATTELPEKVCRERLEAFLTRASLPENERGRHWRACLPGVQASPVFGRCRRALNHTQASSTHGHAGGPTRGPDRPWDHALSHPLLPILRPGVPCRYSERGAGRSAGRSAGH